MRFGNSFVLQAILFKKTGDRSDGPGAPAPLCSSSAGNARRTSEGQRKPHSDAGTASVPTQQLQAARAETSPAHLCHLDMDSPLTKARNTGIICTVGPAPRSVEMLKGTIKSGMQAAPGNLAPGAHEPHAETIRSMHAAGKLCF